MGKSFSFLRKYDQNCETSQLKFSCRTRISFSLSLLCLFSLKWKRERNRPLLSFVLLLRHPSRVLSSNIPSSSYFDLHHLQCPRIFVRLSLSQSPRLISRFQIISHHFPYPFSLSMCALFSFH